MTHRERLETAWSFREPDRVPIEMAIDPNVREMPIAERLVELMEEHADNFIIVPGADFGFLGFPMEEENTEVIEEVPGEYRKVRRTRKTAAGDFTAITYHPEGFADYHWEKRYVSTPNDLARLADTPRAPITLRKDKWKEAVAKVGDRGVPLIEILHPLGTLVRCTDMEEMYAWFYEEPALIHRFLAAANEQVAETIERMMAEGMGPFFVVGGHEMLIPPWMGRRLFNEFAVPYDKRVNDVIRKFGGKLRLHCHGNCMEYLETFVQMGISSVEPLEPSPEGNVDLAEAKRRVGDRMLLSGNIPSQHFMTMSPRETRRRVKEAIRAAAPGGGYTLRTTGGHAGTCCDMPEESLKRVLENCEAYLLAGLEYGQYPIGNRD